MSEGRPKKRKTQNACDECHRRKVRCDGVDAPGSSCAECLSMMLPCTYTITKKKPGPKPGSSRRAPIHDSVQSLITAIISAPNSYTVPDDNPDKIRAILVTLATYARDLEVELTKIRTVSPSLSGNTTPLGTESELNSQTTDIDVNDALATRLDLMSINASGRHFGASSHFMLVRTALDMRDNLNGEPQMITLGRKVIPIRDCPWHKKPVKESPTHVFPEDDLLKELVNLYFTFMHPLYPLLHRPTFEKSISEGLHLRESSFGATVLAVCALGSRYSNDPRNFYEGSTSEHSLGWKYFSQLRLMPSSFAEAASLHEIQLYCLAVSFLQPTFASAETWPLIALAIRRAQEVGVHRRKILKKKDSTQCELWTRAFWQLMVFDTNSSTARGRPQITKAVDFDLDFPSECDDEYWDSSNTKEVFGQPENKPSYMTFWIHYLKLMKIIGIANQTIYAVNRSEVPGRGGVSEAEWNQNTVMELDSALNSWMDSMPEHLKYDPHREDELFSRQSVMLYACYYWVQILVHKTFLPRPGQDSLSSFPSLAICANAARSCVHMLESHHQRTSVSHSPYFLAPLFSAAMTLLTNLWTGIRQKISLDPNKEMMDVEKCLYIMNMYEKKYEGAGRLRDVLQAVISASQLPAMSNISTSKRARSPSDPSEKELPLDVETHCHQPARQIAGSRRVSLFRSVDSAIPTPASCPKSDKSFDQSRFHPFHSSDTVGLLTPRAMGFNVTNSDNIPMLPGLFQVNSKPNEDFVQADIPASSTEKGSIDCNVDALAYHYLPLTNFSEGTQQELNAAAEWTTSGLAEPHQRSQEDWDSFMANVDEILEYVNSGEF